MPVQSMARAAPSFIPEAFARLGVNYPDQAIISVVVHGTIDPKDSLADGDLFFGSNHLSGLSSWRFVTKANDAEKEKGHLFGFPITVSPPIYPAMYSPTGAVHKKTRAGLI